MAALEKSNRWKEELDIATKEMEWSTRFFLGKAQHWADLGSRLVSEGHDAASGVICYAERQRSMWGDFAAHAQKRYQEVNTGYLYLQSST